MGTCTGAGTGARVGVDVIVGARLGDGGTTIGFGLCVASGGANVGKVIAVCEADDVITTLAGLGPLHPMSAIASTIAGPRRNIRR